MTQIVNSVRLAPKSIYLKGSFVEKNITTWSGFAVPYILGVPSARSTEEAQQKPVSDHLHLLFYVLLGPIFDL